MKKQLSLKEFVKEIRIIILIGLVVIPLWLLDPNEEIQEYEFEIDTDSNYSFNFFHVDIDVQNENVIISYDADYHRNIPGHVYVKVPSSLTLIDASFGDVRKDEISSDIRRMTKANRYLFYNFPRSIDGLTSMHFKGKIVPNGRFLLNIIGPEYVYSHAASGWTDDRFVFKLGNDYHYLSGEPLVNVDKIFTVSSKNGDVVYVVNENAKSNSFIIGAYNKKIEKYKTAFLYLFFILVGMFIERMLERRMLLERLIDFFHKKE